MKVALVHEILAKMGGAERVLSVLQEQYPDAPIYTLFYDEKECGKTFPKAKIKTAKTPWWFFKGLPRQFLVGNMPRMIEDFDFSNYDLVISSSSAFAHGIITPSTTPHICYVHAPMRYVWDYTHEYIKEKSPKRNLKRFLIESIMHSLRIWDYSAGGRPDIILANSKTTQKRIQKFWRKESTVLFPPVDIDRFTPQEKNEGYYFIVSMLEPFKKIDIAVEAFKDMPDKKLIIIGDGSQKKNLETLANGSSNIEFLGKKDDKEVKKYMENSKAFIFPGLEDFGITPVEAMACGKPVICYGKGGVTESVINGETGIFFNQQTSHSLKKAVEEFESASTSFDINTIRKRAEKFSIQSFKESLASIISQKI